MIKKNLIFESILGALILFSFLIYQIIDGYYAITVFMAIAGICFLISSVITAVLNRKALSRKAVLQLILFPLGILAVYALVGALSGTLL